MPDKIPHPKFSEGIFYLPPWWVGNIPMVIAALVVVVGIIASIGTYRSTGAFNRATDAAISARVSSQRNHDLLVKLDSVITDVVSIIDSLNAANAVNFEQFNAHRDANQADNSCEIYLEVAALRKLGFAGPLPAVSSSVCNRAPTLVVPPMRSTSPPTTIRAKSKQTTTTTTTTSHTTTTRGETTTSTTAPDTVTTPTLPQ